MAPTLGRRDALEERRRQLVAERDRTSAEVRSRAKRRVFVLVAVLVASTVVSPLLRRAQPATTYAVASGSMEPVLPKGALVFIDRRAPAVGDVVVYWSPFGDYQVHRVVAEEVIGDRLYYTTKGDANGASDSFKVPADAVVGVVERHVAYAGYPWTLSPSARGIGFAAALALYIAITAWDARPVLRGRERYAAAVLLVALLVAPAAGATVQSGYPSSVVSADVATTPLPMAAGTMGS
ncbi:MAG: signal peptidase I, partial [Methanobacteriota archaeon]